MLYPPFTNPLVFPCGAPLAIDTANPAALKCRWACVFPGGVSGGGGDISSIDLLKASSVISASGGSTGGIDGYLGPSVTPGGTNGFSSMTTTVAVTPAAVNHIVTFAGMVTPLGTNASVIIFGDSSVSTSCGNVLETNGSGVLIWIRNAGGTPVTITSTITLVTGAPYFLCVSSSDAVGVNFTALRLDTGQLLQSSVANTTAVTVTTNGILSFPPTDIADGFFKNYGPLAFSTAFLGLLQQKQWAASPWYFWYAQPFAVLDELVGAAVAALTLMGSQRLLMM